MQPVRILHVVSIMDRGGAESRMMDFYRKIDRTRVQFDFAVHHEEPGYFDEEIRSLGGRIHHLPQVKPARYFQYKKAWRELFARYPEYKIVHAHATMLAAIFLKEAKKCGVPVRIVHSHNASEREGMGNLKENILKIPFRWIATDYFACSKKAGLFLFGKKRMNSGQVKLVNNAIEADCYIYNEKMRKEIRSEFGLGDKLVVGHVGRLAYAKNHGFLLDIFKEILVLNPNAVLLLLGKGELEEKIRDKVKALGLEKSVIFAGLRSDVPAVMQAFDVFVFPSIHEGLPSTVVEAQAAGLPCLVSTNVTEEVAITGLVRFLPLDLPAVQWAEAVLSTQDGLIRRDMSEQIKDAGYDASMVAGWLEKFYLSKLLNG